MKKKNTVWQKALFGALLFLVLALPVSVFASGSAVRVTVNGKLSGTLEKKRGGWYLECQDLKISRKKADQRVVRLQIRGRGPFQSGFYYCGKSGRLDTRKRFHALNTKAGGRRFWGTYYFGGKNGRLYEKKGWVAVRGRRYCLSSRGRMYQNCWRKGYYFDGRGRIAKSTRTPDGRYVDCDGKRCKKEEVALSGLKKSLNATISQLGGTMWSVYVKDLKTGDVLSINEKATYPASVCKLFVMEGVYDAIQKGQIAKTSGVDALLRSMITVSDNEAYNQLLCILGKGDFVAGCANLNAYLRTAGYTHSGCHHTIHPSSSPRMGDGQLNVGMALETGLLLERIYKGTCVSKAYSREMENLLLLQRVRGKIPAGLPAGVRCGNKTGESGVYQHDAAIVYGPRTHYVVCIYSVSSEQAGISGIRRLSSQIYHALNR